MLELTEISFYFQGISLGIRKLVTEMFSFCIVEFSLGDYLSKKKKKVKIKTIEWSKALKTGI